MPFDVESARQAIRDELASEIYARFEEYYWAQGGVGDPRAMLARWTPELLRMQQQAKDSFLTNLNKEAYREAQAYGGSARSVYAADVQSLQRLDREFQDLIEERFVQIMRARLMQPPQAAPNTELRFQEMLFGDLRNLDRNDLKGLLNQAILKIYAGITRWSIETQQSPWVAFEQLAPTWQRYSYQAMTCIQRAMLERLEYQRVNGLISWHEGERSASFISEFGATWPPRVKDAVGKCLADWQAGGYGPPPPGLMDMFG